METLIMEEILLIDDDVELCSMLKDYLVKQGFQVHAIHDGKAGLQAALNRTWAMVLLDVMLPGIDGYEILRRLRMSSSVGVLLLSARGDYVDRVVGLEMGADDYLPKPFKARELLARMRAILRRSGKLELTNEERPAPAKVLRVAGIEMDTSARSVIFEGTAIELTSVEFSLLEAFMRQPGEIILRETLTDSVLGRTFHPFDRSLDMHVSRVRRKLEQVCRMGDLIKTIRGKGYQFAVPDQAG